jgi:hypothetical protein
MNSLDELLSLFEAPSSRPRALEAGKLALEKTANLRWTPNPGPQTDAYFSEADELFYGGAAGGGKTDLLCGLALDQHFRAAIFRREGVDLRGVTQRLVEIMGTTDGYNDHDKIWKFSREKTVELCACQYEKDKLSYQGRPHDFYGFDEICQFTKAQYQYIIGWNRSTRRGQRCRVVAAGNPPQTPEGYWVKEAWAPWLDKAFPNPAKPGELRWYTTDEETGRTKWVDKDWRGKDASGNVIAPKSRTFIPALLSDNPELPETYRATIQGMPEPLRSQLLYGDFDAAERDQINQVIPTVWIRAAQERWKANPPKPDAKMISVGVDMAQGGDDETVFAIRVEGRALRECIAYPGRDTPDGPTAAALLLKHLRNKATPNIDMGGGFGQSTYDHLSANGIRAEKMVASGESLARNDSGLKFVNKRAEWWWKMRDALDPGKTNLVKLPPDERLAADLAAPMWKLMPRGIQIEAKDEVRKRLGRSPDRGDAVVMAFASPLTDDAADMSRPRREKRNAWAA